MWRGIADLEDSHGARRLEIDNSLWNNAGNKWASNSEKKNFQVNGPSKFPSDALYRRVDTGVPFFQSADKAAFTILETKNDGSLFICSIVPVQEGDILGVFAGKIRLSENWNACHGIPGPIKDLGLDYSRVTGTLNQMQVSEPNGRANVNLQWETLDDGFGNDCCTTWRVSVKALGSIIPFEPYVCAAPQKEQYALHASPEYAKNGFLQTWEQATGQCNVEHLS